MSVSWVEKKICTVSEYPDLHSVLRNINHISSFKQHACFIFLFFLLSKCFVLISGMEIATWREDLKRSQQLITLMYRTEEMNVCFYAVEKK